MLSRTIGQWCPGPDTGRTPSFLADISGFLMRKVQSSTRRHIFYSTWSHKKVPADPHNGNTLLSAPSQILARTTNGVPTEVNVFTDLPVWDKSKIEKALPLSSYCTVSPSVGGNCTSQPWIKGTIKPRDVGGFALFSCLLFGSGESSHAYKGPLAKKQVTFFINHLNKVTYFLTPQHVEVVPLKSCHFKIPGTKHTSKYV